MAAQTPEQREAIRLQAELRVGITKVPPQYANWSHQRSVEFKTTIKTLKKLAAKSNPGLQEMTSAHNTLAGFWR